MVVCVGIVPLEIDPQGGKGPDIPSRNRIAQGQALENAAYIDSPFPVMAGIDNIFIPVIDGCPGTRVGAVAGTEFQVFLWSGP